MLAICSACCKADLLKRVVATSAAIGTCSLCLRAERQVVETSDPEFVLAIKALIRYHFAEWEYHSKLGGESFQTLLSSADNQILLVNPDLDELEFEEFLLSFLEDIDRNDDVTLFTAYGREIYQYRAMPAVSDGECDLIQAVTAELKRRNHFLVEADFEPRFKSLCPYVSLIVDAGTIWSRARIGATKRAADAMYRIDKDSLYFVPHADASLGAPPVGATSAGRLNRPGVSYLYLASDVDTAVAEVRPHPGEHVSVGKFQLTKPQTVADFSQHPLSEMWRTDEELAKLETIVAIERAFATAAPPSDRRLYSLTQFLAETFRRLGFDGVQFRSTVGIGMNLVLFDPSACKWSEGSSRVVEIEHVRYEYRERKLFDPTADYDIDFEAVRTRA